MRLILATLTHRDRVLLTLEMTEALRPSELFALRWRSFEGSKLTITETLVLYRMRPIVEVRRWALCWGRVRYSGLKEAAPGEAIMPIQSCWG